METVIRPENEMKNSGVEWVEYIPKNWNCIPLKRYFQFGKGLPITKADLTETGEKVISYGQIHAKFNTGVSVNDRLIRFVSDKYKLTNANSLCSKGDIILADTSEDKEGCGNAVYIDCDEKIFAGYHTIILKSTKNNKYLAYLFQSDSWRNQIRTRVNGVKLFSITQKILNQCTIILPPLSEQQIIADYLDEKCSKIDDIIAEANASVEEYKELKQAVIDNATMTGIHDSEMKDTDYVWFPEMPKSWDLVLASLLFREDVRPVNANDVSLSLSQVDGLIPTDDMSERSLKSATHDNWKHVIPDDLVLNRFKGHLGVFFASKYTGMVSFHYGVYHAIRDDVYAKYYEYLFHSTTYKNIFALKSNGITVGLQNLSNGNFYSVKILHPTLDEQIEIVKYLDKRTAEIDSLIAEKESLIKDLESYKKSLIYEVVTGKRRVV